MKKRKIERKRNPRKGKKRIPDVAEEPEKNETAVQVLREEMYLSAIERDEKRDKEAYVV